MHQALNTKLRSIQNLVNKPFVIYVNINCISLMLSQDVISYFSTTTSVSLTTIFKHTSIHLNFGTESTGEFETCLGEHCEQHYLLLAL